MGVTEAFLHPKYEIKTSAELSCVLDLQESQAVPLSNISSVLAESTSGKTSRRLHFQDEAHGGAAESSTDTGNGRARTGTLSSADSSSAHLKLRIPTYPQEVMHNAAANRCSSV